jgi:hypothetical protein
MTLDVCSGLADKDWTGAGKPRPQRIEKMARIARTTRSEVYAQHLAIRAEVRENGDCAIRAMALLTGADYKTVHALAAKHGRKHGCGTTFSAKHKVLADLGFSLIRVPTSERMAIIACYPGAHKNLQSITTHHPVRFAKVWSNVGDLMFHTQGHVAAFKDGRIHDWSEGRACRVIDLYRVVKLPIDGQAVDWFTGKAI